MTLPLLHLIIKPETTAHRVALGALAVRHVLCAGAECFALGVPRSGVPVLLLVWRSKHRARLSALPVRWWCWSALSLMTDLQRERYVSIFSHSAKGGQTAEPRINGVIGDFKVSLRRPLFGHGLGTSREANANFRGEDLPSHDLYLEAAEELGYVGLALVLALIWSFLQRLLDGAQHDRRLDTDDDRGCASCTTSRLALSWWWRLTCSSASPPSGCRSPTGTSSAGCPS